MQIPEWLEEPLLHLVHHSTVTLEGLLDKALAKFDARYVVGEELAALDENKERPCVIRAITSAKRPDGVQALCFLTILIMRITLRTQHWPRLLDGQHCRATEAVQRRAPQAWPGSGADGRGLAAAC